MIRVSVPSRGLSYLNHDGIKQCNEGFKCFRPLTGTLLSKLLKDNVYRKVGNKVSVPSRGLSYLNFEMVNKNDPFVSFRPLTGTLLSKRYVYRQTCIRPSFRPLTGTLLSKHRTTNMVRKSGSFRPLTGTLLSKHISLNCSNSVIGFPSPHGDSLI